MNRPTQLKAVLFDMDGVLYNSMPYHSLAWHEAMEAHGLHLSREEAFLHEGRTGAATINIVYQRQYGTDASPELIQQIYEEKCRAFARFPEPDPMPGARELIEQIKARGIQTVLVTGSGQRTLLQRLEHHYPGAFDAAHMVTAFDVKYGKPHPEPYLMGLAKAGVAATEAIVVENAPIGVQAAVAAGIYTIAVNTGPLDAQVLLDAGADALYPSMEALSKAFFLVSQSIGSMPWAFR
ncbi:MAG: HAD family hydrolase [Bacteroides sp.]